ncbi:MAG: glycoside hydrolase family 15 protein [Betaproteobacteria bacterium]|nr:glycoside hydrolase family 15 protein [Betaproteobacteria bacterium]MBK7592558.1 glycoside hydrolase family 15 protein [Betaproteobacteria bacterium]MBK7743027.1 glycoside hydrolase family 15 protein [Betaproteobacteria bacterium]MBK8688209.1 glycoside hydrolase family 15 protein [Betaproteobacteria bacterium]MBK9676896.1 glycoside hydrolase family 15 protein [Betaproteobacteria bacterium]
MTANLDLALVGNGQVGFLVDAEARVVWGCLPRFDGDTIFCALLDTPAAGSERGVWAVELVDLVRSEQSYDANTAVLVTRLHDRQGGAIEVVDCAPRFVQHGRVFHPMALLRQLRPLSGSPRVTVRLRPVWNHGALPAETTVGSSHVRYVGPGLTLRLTTDASLTAVVEERAFLLDRELSFLLGPDETLVGGVAETGRRLIEETRAYWRDWVRRLAIPFEWQPAVIRAAITLQQNAFDDTGAIIAALTTSIPEAPASGRNWDYRYCWLRDSYFVVDALNRLNATDTMERYLGYILNVVAGSSELTLQPVYRINGDAALAEEQVASLPGYRGMGPVRVGNDAWRQLQHDVYGSAILAATHVFFDERLSRRGDVALFERLEPLGRRAAEVFDQPDAGLWELRGRAAVHTFSSVMCWAACDRLAKIAARLGLPAREQRWRAEADRIARFINEHCWSERRGSFVSTADGDALDASLLLLADLNFVAAGDPRFVATVEAIGRELKRGDFVFRYVEEDDFGAPQNAFVICSFWYVDALAAIGRRDEARALFLRLLGHRNAHGLLAEHLDTVTGEAWGNFVQTYSMVGLISSAIRLSVPWDAVV